MPKFFFVIYVYNSMYLKNVLIQGPLAWVRAQSRPLFAYARHKPETLRIVAYWIIRVVIVSRLKLMTRCIRMTIKRKYDKS